MCACRDTFFPSKRPADKSEVKRFLHDDTFRSSEAFFCVFLSLIEICLALLGSIQFCRGNPKSFLPLSFGPLSRVVVSPPPALAKKKTLKVAKRTRRRAASCQLPAPVFPCRSDEHRNPIGDAQFSRLLKIKCRSFRGRRAVKRFLIVAI